MLSKFRILVIDDNPLDRELIRDALEKEEQDFIITEAATQREFEDRLTSGVYDLVLSDFNILGFDGLQVIDAIKVRDPQVPVVIVTGTGSEEIAVAALKRGADDYVIKTPAHIQRLPSTIQAVMEKRLLEAERWRAERERRQMEEALRASEERYRTLFDSATEGICMMDGVFLDCNEQAARLWNCRREDILGRSLLDFSPPFQPDGRSSVELAAEYIARARAGAPQFFAWQHRRLDDVLIHTDISLKEIILPGKKLLLVSMRDVTDRQQAEESFETVVSKAPLAIFIIQDKKIIFVNPKFVEITGYSEEELLGQDYFFLVAPEVSEKVRSRAVQMLKGHNLPPYEYQFITKTGETKWVMEQVITTMVKGKRASLGYFVDITEPKKAQEEKEKLTAQLMQAQKMEAIGTLAGGIAHDFNNILGIIIGYTELIDLKEPKTSAIKSKLQQILQAGHRAKDLVKQILTFSRKAEQSRQPVSLGSITQEALKMLRASLPTTIDIRSSINSDSLVRADITQLHQVLMNICTNAAHAMQEEGGILEVSLTDVDFEAATPHPEISPGAYLKLTIADTGHGIEPEIKERIFEPFFTTKGVGKGTGLGLSLVYGIVKGYGGAINVYSEPGQGTTFNIYLPRYGDKKIQATSLDLPLPTGTERILLVDDEEGLAALGQQILESLGYQVTSHIHSMAALKEFQANPGMFDLVITDQTMPQMTGIKLARELLRIRPDIPIILCTGFSETVTAEKCKDLGIKDLIMKPVLAEKLAWRIRAILDESRKPLLP
jgi:PAS domain S-box-containing protein